MRTKNTKTPADAVRWLACYMLHHNGSAYVDTIMSDSRGAGFIRCHVRRAREVLEITSRQSPTDPARFVWTLPDTIPGDFLAQIRRLDRLAPKEYDETNSDDQLNQAIEIALKKRAK
jgi:hypothetical protein